MDLTLTIPVPLPFKLLFFSNESSIESCISPTCILKYVIIKL